jgi:tetratricopeptide (TPR) repeat protein
MDRRGLAVRPKGVEAPETEPTGADPVRTAMADGRYDDAVRAYFALPAPAAQGALSAEEAVALASRLRQDGHSDAALQLLRRVGRDVRRGEGLAEVYALAGTILLEDRGEPTAAYQYLLTALELGPRPETAAAVRQGLAAIERLQKRRVGRLHAPSRW